MIASIKLKEELSQINLNTNRYIICNYLTEISKIEFNLFYPFSFEYAKECHTNDYTSSDEFWYYYDRYIKR